MPYEATVPVHRRLLWPALIDPERLLGALPNAVVDASGNQGVAGRLRVRIREQTVTFRGIARIIEVIPASLRVILEVEAAFGRSGGAIEGVVEITLHADGSGTRAVVDGNLHRTEDSPPLPPQDAVDAAVGRIVRRWFAALAESSPGIARAETEIGEEPSTVAEPPRAAERAPLAVVRDVPSKDSTAVSAAALADAEEEQPDEGDEHRTEVEHDAGSGPKAVPAAEEGADRAQAGLSGSAAATAPRFQLRLVSSRNKVSAEGEEPAAHAEGGGLAERRQAAGYSQEPDDRPAIPSDCAEYNADLGEDLGEDIWSRLRDQGLPRWIPMAASALLAALGTALVFVVALRRRHRRRRRR
jgi:carbon monoxide dehydrogenase subunit G